jgi:transcriptional regulator with XRE-family HTH domain
MNLVESKKVGELLREWRTRRRLSQLDLAYDVEISPKHLSFLETGRSQPSRDMVLRLSERLGLPLRERNSLLTAAGFAMAFPERRLDDEPLAAARKAVDLILTKLEPNPTFAVDRHWTFVAANKAADIFTVDVDPELLVPPVNMLRLCLHPGGFTPRVLNYTIWRKNVIGFLDQQVQITADPFLTELAKELRSYPKPELIKDISPANEIDYSIFAVPLQLMTKHGELSFISTVTVFGTPIDVTVSELAIETFFPADKQTADALNKSNLSTG